MDRKAPGDGDSENEKTHGLSPQVLDYYKRFGKHRDLEQYFSLTTVQEEVRNPGSSFWSSMKEQDTSPVPVEPPVAEVCRISISCSVADQDNSSQEDTYNSEKQEAGSPPIISEDVQQVVSPRQEDHKSDLDISRKSTDPNLDCSLNKPSSPTSSVASQRKLDWDSLADVGYANEKDSKTKILSTLERLALRQQFSISDDVNKDISGNPAAFSTPEDVGFNKKYSKKNMVKDLTKFTQKGVDKFEVNVDTEANKNINLNYTKHIQFKVDPNSGETSVTNSNTIYKVDEEKQTEIITASKNPKEIKDKEIQTVSANDSKSKSKSHTDCIAAVPIILNLDLLKKGKYKGFKYHNPKLNIRKRKMRPSYRKSPRHKNKNVDKTAASEATLGGSQVSETDSFEYMPAHVYQQNKDRNSGEHPFVETSNKSSSFDSSGGYTSSKNSDHSLTKDLEKSLALISSLVRNRHQDAEIRNKLVKAVVHKLVQRKYRDETSDFLSGLSSKSLGISAPDKTRYTTTSTSDNSGEMSSRPIKPILRTPRSSNKHSPSITHVTQETSADIHNPPEYNKTKNAISMNKDNSTKHISVDKHSDSHLSKEKSNLSTSDSDFTKTSSEVLYQKYLKALERERKYKEQLNSKQDLLREKLVKNPSTSLNSKSSSVKDLIKDLTNNNFPQGAGDTIEPQSNPETNRNWNTTKFRNHSVFTITNTQFDREPQKPGPSKLNKLSNDNSPTATEQQIINQKNPKHFCCCPLHADEGKKVESAVQVQLKESDVDLKHQIISENFLQFPSTSNNKFVCFCSSNKDILDNIPNKFMIVKCPNFPFCEEVKKSQSVQCDPNPTSGPLEEVDSKNRVIKISTSTETIDQNIHPSLSVASVKTSTDNIHNRPRAQTLPMSMSKEASCKVIKSKKTPISSFTQSQDFELKKILNRVDTCIQTNMSINPRVTQTALGDIKIIQDNSIVDSGKDDNLRSKEEVTTNYENYPELYRTVSTFSNLKRNENDAAFNDNFQSDMFVNKSDPSQNGNDYFDDKIFQFLDSEKSDITLEDDEVIHIEERVTCTSDSDVRTEHLEGKYLKTKQSTECQTCNNEINSKLSPKTLKGKKKCLDSTTDNSDNSGQIKIAREYTAQWLKQGKILPKNVNTRKDANCSTAKTSIINSSGSTTKEALIESIEDIIKRYGKNKVTNTDKRKSRQRHYKEIIDKLKYLLQTESNSGDDISSLMSLEGFNDKTERETQTSVEKINIIKPIQEEVNPSVPSKVSDGSRKIKEVIYPMTLTEKSKLCTKESSDLGTTTDIPDTSETSFTCKIIKKIRNECEKYHKKHCNCVHPCHHQHAVCGGSSTTLSKEKCETVNVRNISKIHSVKCCKHPDAYRKKSIAYNLVIQPTHVVKHKSEQPDQKVKLQDVVVRVPSHKIVSNKCSRLNHYIIEEVKTKNIEMKKSKERVKKQDKTRKDVKNEMGKGDQSDSESPAPCTSGRSNEVRKIKFLTVREYLERNRPDFITNTGERQKCLRIISDSRREQQALIRKLLSSRSAREGGGGDAEWGERLRAYGDQLRMRRPQAKFLSERAMKEHSRRIYKSLPEVVQKKEEAKKEGVKRTNLVMSSLYGKNLQKRALKGAVDVSNYSSVITI